MFILRHMHKLSFRRLLIILLRPLPAQALIHDGRFNNDGQKHKREYINKTERMLVRIIFFINNTYIWIE